MMIDVDPPFGTYALPPEREAWRIKAGDQKNSRIGRLMTVSYTHLTLPTILRV